MPDIPKLPEQLSFPMEGNESEHQPMTSGPRTFCRTCWDTWPCRTHTRRLDMECALTVIRAQRRSGILITDPEAMEALNYLQERKLI